MNIESKGVMMEEVKRNNNGIFIAIIVVLLAIIAGLLFMILNKDNNKEKTNEEEIVETEYNYSEIDKVLHENLIHFLRFRGRRDGTNELETSERRLELVNSILMSSGMDNVYDDGTMQGFPYVAYDVYKQKYIELYGSSTSFEQDLKEVGEAIANNDCYGKLSGNNICWNGNWGSAGPMEIILESEEVSKVEDNNYKIIGKYIVKFEYSKLSEEFKDGIPETGKFEIEYFKNSNTKYLTSIKLTKIETEIGKETVEENISEKTKIKNSLENIYKDLMNGTPRTDVGIDNGNANFKMVSGNMESFEVVDIKKRTNTCATVDDYQITFKYKCKNNSYDCIYVEQIGTEPKSDNNYYQLTQYFEIDENYNIIKFKGSGMLSFNPNCKIEIKDVD